jgi:hypothetical protein
MDQNRLRLHDRQRPCQAIVRADRWREQLEIGQHGTAADLPKAAKVNDSYLSRVLRLTLLAPDIVEAILDGGRSAHWSFVS